VDPCAAQKKDEVELLYSTLEPACGQTDETAKKLVNAFPAEVRITIMLFLATNSLIFLISVAKSTVKLAVFPVGFEPDGEELGSGLSEEQAAAIHATQVSARPPVNLFKNSSRLISI
jgi:hypothetical protein